MIRDWHECLEIAGRRVVIAPCVGSQFAAYFADCRVGEPIGYGANRIDAAADLQRLANSYQAEAIATAQSEAAFEANERELNRG